MIPSLEAWPLWLSDPTENYRSIEILSLLKLRKGKFFRYTPASIGLSNSLENTREESVVMTWLWDLHTYFSPVPSCLHLGKQLWVMNAVPNKTTVIADVALGVIFPWENSQGPDRINQLSLFRCLTFMWGLWSSIIHANAASWEHITLILCSALIIKQGPKWVFLGRNMCRWLQLDERMRLLWSQMSLSQSLGSHTLAVWPCVVTSTSQNFCFFIDKMEGCHFLRWVLRSHEWEDTWKVQLCNNVWKLSMASRTIINVNSLPLTFSLPLPFLPLDGVGASVPCRYQCRTGNTRGGITQDKKKEGEKSLYVENGIYNELSQYLPLLRGERENRKSLGGRGGGQGKCT